MADDDFAAGVNYVCDGSPVCREQQRLYVRHASMERLYSAPDERLQPMALAWDAVHFIVGVHGDEWFLVMTEDGRVGYVRQACFWPGNG